MRMGKHSLQNRNFFEQDEEFPDALKRTLDGYNEAPQRSATHGMNLHQRILHVGGRENAQTYIEFGSVAAVRALVAQVLRDWPDGAHGFAMPAPQPQADALDTERLDWLIEQGCSNGVVYEFDKSFWMAWLDGHDAHKDKHQIGRYHTAREAIDAAIAAAKENKS